MLTSDLDSAVEGSCWSRFTPCSMVMSDFDFGSDNGCAVVSELRYHTCD